MVHRDINVFKTVQMEFNIPIAVLLGGGNEVRILCMYLFLSLLVYYCYTDFMCALRKLTSELQQFLSLRYVKWVGKD